MWLVAPLIGFFLAIIFHAVLIRILPDRSKLILFLFSGCLFGAASILLVADEYSAFSIQLLGSASLYAFACELYIFLFSSVLTSISMNTLVMVLKGPISDEDLKSSYNGEKMVRYRLQRLIDIGMLTQAPNGAIHITDKGYNYLVYMKRLIDFFKNN